MGVRQSKSNVASGNGYNSLQPLKKLNNENKKNMKLVTTFEPHLNVFVTTKSII